jgi:hypothetical protein
VPAVGGSEREAAAKAGPAHRQLVVA